MANTHLSGILLDLPFDGVVLSAPTVARKGGCSKPHTKHIECTPGVADRLAD